MPNMGMNQPPMNMGMPQGMPNMGMNQVHPNQPMPMGMPTQTMANQPMSSAMGGPPTSNVPPHIAMNQGRSSPISSGQQQFQNPGQPQMAMSQQRAPGPQQNQGNMQNMQQMQNQRMQGQRMPGQMQGQPIGPQQMQQGMGGPGMMGNQMRPMPGQPMPNQGMQGQGQQFPGQMMPNVPNLGMPQHMQPMPGAPQNPMNMGQANMMMGRRPDLRPGGPLPFQGNDLEAQKQKLKMSQTKEAMTPQQKYMNEKGISGPPQNMQVQNQAPGSVPQATQGLPMQGMQAQPNQDMRP